VWCELSGADDRDSTRHASDFASTRREAPP
jgi:hypothetical protein